MSTVKLELVGKQWAQIRTCAARRIADPFTLSYNPSSEAFSFRLVSYNLRYDTKQDGITVKESLARMQDPSQQPLYLGLAGHEQPWSSRRIRIAQDILNEGVVLAGAFNFHAGFKISLLTISLFS